MTRARARAVRTERVLAAELVVGDEVTTTDAQSYKVRSALLSDDGKRIRVISDTGWVFSMPAETKLVRIERYVRLPEGTT